MSAVTKQDNDCRPAGLTILRDLVAHDTTRMARSAADSLPKPARHDTCVMRVVFTPAEHLLEQA